MISQEKQREYNKIYYTRNREKIQVAAALWKENNRIRNAWLGAKKRATVAGIEFSILPGDIVVPDKCPILGIPLRWIPGLLTDGTPSIDRVDNSLGYHKNNISVISTKANRLKSDNTVETLTAIINYMTKGKDYDHRSI